MKVYHGSTFIVEKPSLEILNYRTQGKNIKNINKEEHINKANIFDTINIMILFAGGTYYIFNIKLIFPMHRNIIARNKR